MADEVMVDSSESESERESMEGEETMDYSMSGSEEEESIEGEETMDSSESGSEEDDLDYPYVNTIRNCLGLVARPGSFACGGVLEKAQLQLSVKGVGKIKLPLSNKQGKVLKSKCTAAPFGVGSETFVSKIVRDAWQVDAKHVKLNKKFSNLIEEKIKEIIPTLMGESFIENQQVESELYKLVYYEIGGHFIAHRDTEKAPGMFATLVIQLPAAHEGGALVVRQKGETKVFDFGDDSEENFFFTAFFADCEHELRKVTSGHRLVLIYNLVHKNSTSTLNPNNNDNIQPSNQNFITTMRTSVEEWKLDNVGPQYLALKLDHLYTKTNTSFQNLKGRDKNLADALCLCDDIEIYLATLTKTEKRHGYDDDDPCIHDVDSCLECKPDLVSEDEIKTECSYILHNWMGVNKKKAPFGKLELHKNEMLIKEEYMFEKYEEQSSTEYEYTGNEGCNINYFYEKKALVFWPKSHNILISCDTNFSSVLDNCKKLSKNKKEDALEMLKGIILYIEKRHKTAMRLLKDTDKVANIFELMILYDDSIKCLANTFLLALIKPYRSDNYDWDSKKGKVGLPNINSAIALANLIHKFWESIEDSVLMLVKECAVSQTECCAKLVSSLLSLGLYEQADSIVEVAAYRIEALNGKLSIKGGAAWGVLLASNDIFSICFDDFVKRLSKKNYILVGIIAEMHRSLDTEVINQCRIKKGFQTLLSSVQANGWKSLSVRNITLIWPIILLIDKFNPDISLLDSFSQAVIEQKYSNHIYDSSGNMLKTLLELPDVYEAKNNPSVQLMVHKRLQQLDVSRPVFSWAQPKAFIYPSCWMSSSYDDDGGPSFDEINNFLKSDKETKNFGGVFRNKTDAMIFGKEYFKNGKYDKRWNYSARYEVTGKGSNVIFKIIKTKDYFNRKMSKYNLLCKEAKVLKKMVCEPKKTVSRKRALE